MNSAFKQKLKNIAPSLISIVIGLLFGWYLLLIAYPQDCVAGFGTLLAGGFNAGISGLGTVLYNATPIIMTGLSVGLGFKAGLFNIGASGQFTVGAFAAIYVGATFTSIPAGLHCVIAILAGCAAGAIWGLLAGFLKAYFKVNEVISGIMLNYIGMLLVKLLVKNYCYNSMYNRSADVLPSAQLSRGFFNSIIPDCQIDLGFFIALAMVIVAGIVLNKTTFGYEIKTVGRNSFAAQYAGISVKKNIMLTMLISGLLSGMGGALMYLCDRGDHITVVETILQQGFTGISVALLGLSSPLGILIAGIFIAYITTGGYFLQLYSYSSEIVNMIIAVIVYCGALVLPIKLLFERIELKRKLKRETTITGKEALK